MLLNCGSSMLQCPNQLPNLFYHNFQSSFERGSLQFIPWVSHGLLLLLLLLIYYRVSQCGSFCCCWGILVCSWDHQRVRTPHAVLPCVSKWREPSQLLTHNS